LIVDGGRNADTAGFCDALKPCRDIHAIPEDVMRLDDYVADIDAHSESNAPIFQITDRKTVDASLELRGSSNCFHRAPKLRQKTVPGVLDNPAAVFGNCRGDSVRQERCRFGVRGLLVIMHEARIASHVGGQYRRQPALDPD
jgi:hypothetical protein